MKTFTISVTFDDAGVHALGVDDEGVQHETRRAVIQVGDREIARKIAVRLAVTEVVQNLMNTA